MNFFHGAELLLQVFYLMVTCRSVSAASLVGSLFGIFQTVTQRHYSKEELNARMQQQC